MNNLLINRSIILILTFLISFSSLYSLDSSVLSVRESKVQHHNNVSHYNNLHRGYVNPHGTVNVNGNPNQPSTIIVPTNPQPDLYQQNMPGHS